MHLFLQSGSNDKRRLRRVVALVFVLTISGLTVVFTVMWHSLDHDTLDDTIRFLTVVSVNEMLISSSLTLAVYKSWRKYWREGVRNPKKYFTGGGGGSRSTSSFGSNTSSVLTVSRPSGLIVARPPASKGGGGDEDQRRSKLGMQSLASSTDSIASMATPPFTDGGSYVY